MNLKEDLSQRVTEMLKESWDEREGRIIPSVEGLELRGGAVKLEATFLYADLVQSTILATDFYHKTAAKVIKIYLTCMCKLIKSHNGQVVSFDGDRVMGVFRGECKNSDATLCALRMNNAVTNIIRPRLRNHFTSLKKKEFTISHCVGIDTSAVFVVRAGLRGTNDLVWIGRAPNLAAKLSDRRHENYSTYISEKVYSSISESLKYEDDKKKFKTNDHPLDLSGILPKKIPIRRSASVNNISKIAGLPILNKSIWDRHIQSKNIFTPMIIYRTKCYHEF